MPWCLPGIACPMLHCMFHTLLHPLHVLINRSCRVITRYSSQFGHKNQALSIFPVAKRCGCSLSSEAVCILSSIVCINMPCMVSHSDTLGQAPIPFNKMDFACNFLERLKCCGEWTCGTFTFSSIQRIGFFGICRSAKCFRINMIVFGMVIAYIIGSI